MIWFVDWELQICCYVVFILEKKKKLGKFVLFRLGKLQIYEMFKRICGNIYLYKYVEYIFLLYFINFKKINFYFIFIWGCIKNILKENEYKIVK